MQVQTQQVLFSRYKDGAKPVRVLPDGWEVLWGANQGTKYKTRRGLLAALTGHPEGRHWSFDRYFGLGRYSKPSPLVEADIYDIFGTAPIHITSNSEISVPALTRKNQARKLSSVGQETPQLGIDLAKRAHEVRKLLYAGFGRRMYLSGYDPEDVLQEVYKGLLVRNAGKCPWDPRKSSFGHYVHMVCSCVLSNYHRKQHRVHEIEQLGLPNPKGKEDGQGSMDVGSHPMVVSVTSVEEQDLLLQEEADSLTDYLMDSSAPEGALAIKVLPLLLSGTPRDAMAPALGVSKASIGRAIAFLRKQATEWHSNPPAAF